jgi:hypothetical protein
MAIELSNLTFTEQDDVVPASGVEEIINTGIANTLAGKDTITGTSSGYGLVNGFPPPNDNNNPSIIDTGKGDDIITGISYQSNGLINWPNHIINTGDGNDIINGVGYYSGISNLGSMDSGGGNDTITGINNSGGGYEPAITNIGSIDTSDGNDRITGIGGIGISNNGTINTGNGEDSIICQEKITTYGGVFLDNGNAGLINMAGVFLGDGNDSLIVEADVPNRALLKNLNFIGTGEGNDKITSTGVIYNEGVINTGNGEDFIISKVNFFNTGEVFLGNGNDLTFANTNLANRAIENWGTIETGEGNDIIISSGVIYNEGTINTGNGNDSIIANGGFESGYNISGSVFLGDGEDNIKGFGSGDFYGGNGKDTLELTSGSYTVGISGTAVNFTKNSIIMNTSEFEKLKAGGTIYDFSSFTNGQIITVA